MGYLRSNDERRSISAVCRALGAAVRAQVGYHSVTHQALQAGLQQLAAQYYLQQTHVDDELAGHSYSHGRHHIVFETDARQ
jgi:hypothetical protein